LDIEFLSMEFFDGSLVLMMVYIRQIVN